MAPNNRRHLSSSELFGPCSHVIIVENRKKKKMFVFFGLSNIYSLYLTWAAKMMLLFDENTGKYLEVTDRNFVHYAVEINIQLSDQTLNKWKKVQRHCVQSPGPDWLPSKDFISFTSDSLKLLRGHNELTCTRDSVSLWFQVKPTFFTLSSVLSSSKI